MRTLIVALVLMLVNVAQATTFTEVIHAIHMQEGSGKKTVPDGGDNGQAIGPFQIHQKYWVDAVRFTPALGKDHTYNDCHNYDYALLIVKSYLNGYEGKSIASGKWESVIRCHNGGPNWRNYASTYQYYLKVKRFLP